MCNQKEKHMGFLDEIESIDLLVVDSDARMVGLKDVPMMVSDEGYEDFDKYSDVSHIEELKEKRQSMLIKVFGEIRKTELAN